MGKYIRKIANEVGATTGRDRRVGWLDIPVARYSARVDGYTSLALTRLDIFDHLSTIKICTAYTLDGDCIPKLPSNGAQLYRCQPIYEDFKGWDAPTAGATRSEDLPEGARAYIERIEELLGLPVSIVSTGPKRHETIMVRDI